MFSGKREITKDIYERALNNRKYICSEDMDKVFNISEICGYGIYGTQVYKDGEKYFVSYYRGSTCD